MLDKKSVSELRDQILIAHRYFNRVCVEVDHIVCVFSYDIQNLDYKKIRLKDYIMHNFNRVLTVDVFSDYMVIWHDSVAVRQDHRTNKQF